MEMIQQSELVTYECPNCGYITKDRCGEKINCPKCTPDFKGWIAGAKNTEQPVQRDNGGKLYSRFLMSEDEWQEYVSRNPSLQVNQMLD